MSEQRKVEFFKLSRPIQDRFVGSAGNVFAPMPLVFRHVTPKQPLYWAIASLVSLVSLVIVARVGYGDLESSLSRHGILGLVAYVLLIASVIGCAVRAVHLRKRVNALPYRPGVYVFPMSLVDARRETFEVVDMATLGVGNVMPGAPPRVFLSFQGGQKYEFPVDSAPAGETVLASITSMREEVRTTMDRNDPGELVTLDPLHQPRFSSPVAPRDAYVPFAPKWGTFFFAIGLVVGVVFGPVGWYARNVGSDTKMFKTALKSNDVGSYQSYLAHGSSRKDDVTDTLLPRAELREAEKPGTVEALLAYIAAHPNSKIQAEVDDSLKVALLAQLEEAKKAGTLSALTDFATKYAPQRPLIQKEVTAAMHDVYARELASYKAHPPTKDKTVVPFIERLFAWAEAHGPTVEIRARHKSTSNLDKADKFVEKTPNFIGQISYPTRYFDPIHSQKREAALEKDMVDKLSHAFSPELITFKAAGDGPDPALPMPPVTVPTILVTHVEDWSTLTWETKLPRGSFVGVIYRFEAEFFIPGDAKTYKWKQDIGRPAALSVLKQDGEGSNEERLYEQMSHEAFGSFEDCFLATLLPVSSSDKK